MGLQKRLMQRSQRHHLVATKAVCVVVVLDIEGHNGACTAEEGPRSVHISLEGGETGG